MLRAAPMLLALGACDQLPQEPEEPTNPTLLDVPSQLWYIDVLAFDEAYNEMDAKGDRTKGGVDDGYELGGTFTPPIPDEDGVATAEVFATETGKTYWVSAQSPTGAFDGESVVGAVVRLDQSFHFRKDSEGASLRFTISGAYVELLDHNLAFPLSVCPWQGDTPVSERGDVCRDVINAIIRAGYTAYTVDSAYNPEIFFKTSGRAGIHSFAEDVNPVYSVGLGFNDSRAVFDSLDFELALPDDDDVRHQQLRLSSPITVDVPLDAIAVGTVFTVVATAEARAWSRRLNESYAAAYFRDPVSTSAAGSIEYEGVTPLEAPSQIPEGIPAVGPAPPCEVGGSGAIQFETDSYYKPEWPGDKGHVAEITVARTGAEGEASALFTTGGGTATPGPRDTPGSDYEPVSTHVWFAAGETGTRTVDVPIIGDVEAEPDETVTLTLSDPSGCTALGGVTSATLTIRDDDQEGAVDESYTISGTVTGLEGRGLILTNLFTDHLEVTASGPFVFDREYPNGHVYHIRVDTQPTDPSQFCSVSNETGTVAGADVTDIDVDCEKLPPDDEHLDVTFGAGGKVTSDVVGPVADVALQDDGKMVVVGGDGFTGAKLARYNADGSPDTGFGTGGVVAVEFYGSAYDVLNAVAIQSDGRVVAAGYSKDGVNSPTQEDWIIARYNADGTLDTGFGDAGKVITDFDSHGDGAHDVLIQPDGAIVVTGSAALFDTGLADSDFAVVRYTSAGELDTSFGTGGKTTTNIAGQTDLGYAAALQPDGKIVIAGRVAPSGGANPDIGILRYNADGTLDTSFGEDGVVRDQTGDWDEAADVITQPDGGLVIVGHTNTSSSGATTTTLTLARFNADGGDDTAFGIGGRVDDVLGVGRGIALQPDGSLVAAGWVAGESSSDIVIARFNAAGQLDTTFGDGGTIDVDFFGAPDVANAVVIQPDGKIVAAGSAVNGTSTGLGIVRVLP